MLDFPEFERFFSRRRGLRPITKERVTATFSSFINEKVLPNIPDAADVTINHVLKEGRVTDEILKAAKEIDPVMIVMGAKGNGSSKLGWLMGWRDD